MPWRTCRNCKSAPVEPGYYRCAKCLPLTHRGVCADCGADVIRQAGRPGVLPKRCEPCRRRRKYRQTKESQQRALQDPEKLAKEQERRREQMRRWRANNPEKAKELGRKSKQRAYADPERREIIQRNARISRIARKFGMDREAAEAQVAASETGCAICGRMVEGKSLHLDHCHATNTIRGWLCVTCNSGLGQFYDNPETLRAAADYVERFRTPQR